MSDFEESKRLSDAEPTRAIPVVEHEGVSTGRRRRAAATAKKAAESDLRAQGVPRPNALNRASQPAQAAPAQRTAAGSGMAARRPVQAAGYEQRKPLSQEYSQVPPRARDAQFTDRDRDDDRMDDAGEEPRSHRGLITLCVILLLLAAIVLGFMLIPAGNDTTLSRAKATVQSKLSGLLGGAPAVTAAPAAEAIDFTAAPTTGNAPMVVVFSLTTTPGVEDVRLADSTGSVLDAASTLQQNNDDNAIWVLNLPVNDTYEGEVHAQIFARGEWTDTDKAVSLTISAAPVVTAPPVEITAAPTPVPTVEPTAEPTAVPAAEEDPASEAYDLSVYGSEAFAPAEVEFTAVTSSAIDEVRLLNEEGEPLPLTVDMSEDENGLREWSLIAEFTAMYDGEVALQVRKGEEWFDTELAQNVLVEDMPEELGDLESPDAEAESADALPAGATPAPEAVPPAATQRPMSSLSTTPTPDPDAALLPMLTAEDILPDATADTEPVDAEAANAAAPAADAEPAAAADQPESPAPSFVAEAHESADPKLIPTSVIYNGTKKIAEYNRPVDDVVNLGDADTYLSKPYGVLTFRGSSFRQNAAFGTVGDISSMAVAWQREAGSVRATGKKYYYGFGLNDQPAIVKWSKEVRELSNIVDEKKAVTGLREIIVAGEDGYIYFVDLTDGQNTREPINVGYPMRSAPSIDPLGFPFMAVGQYARKMASGTGKIGMRYYNLLTQKQIDLLDGLDGKANRPYNEVGSFNTSALIWGDEENRNSTLLTAGTNGMLYVNQLNPKFSLNEGTFKVTVSSTAVKTLANKEKKVSTAVESSLAGYGNYVFYADVAGYLRCMDTTTMKVVWAVALGDEVDASIALDKDSDGTVWLYAATTLQNRSKGDAVIYRFNAATGEQDWAMNVGVAKNKKKPDSYIPGAVASPVIGQNGLNNLVYYTLSGVSASGAQALLGSENAEAAVLVAIDKTTGKDVWALSLDSTTYSSPVAVYNEDGHGWIIQATSSGMVYLLDGATGSLVSSLQLEGAVNASPAVYKDMLILGTQGKGTSYLYGIQLK